MKPSTQYITRTNDARLLSESSSGGLFTELARVVLREGGLVIGAGWDEKWNVIHKIVDDEAGLAELRGSKYVFSDLSGVMPKMKTLVASGRMVFFVGTPCQVAAVRKLCGEADSLYLCALICQSCASSDLWQKYVHELEAKMRGKISCVRFRDKSDLLLKGRMVIRLDGAAAELSEPLYDNAYMRATGLAARDVCLKCQFRGGRHGADLQIGDCWGVEKLYPAYADCKGSSAVLVFTNKGDRLLQKTNLILIPVNYDDVLMNNPYLESQFAPDPVLRVKFMAANRRMTVKQAVAYAYEGPPFIRGVKHVYRNCRHVIGRVLRKAGLR